MGGWGPGGAGSYGGRERGASPKAPAATAENRVSQGGGGQQRPPDSLLPKSLLSLFCRRTFLCFLSSSTCLFSCFLASVGLWLSMGSYFLCVPVSLSFSVCLCVCVSLGLCVGTGVSLLCDALCLCFCLSLGPSPEFLSPGFPPLLRVGVLL